MGFEISMDSQEWSNYIDLPVDEAEQDRILKLLESVGDIKFKIGNCKEIPELTTAIFTATTSRNCSLHSLNCKIRNRSRTKYSRP